MRATLLSLGLLPVLILAACDRGSGGASGGSSGPSIQAASPQPQSAQPGSPPDQQQSGAKGTIPPTSTPAVALPSFADLAAKLEPAVVNIQVVMVDPNARSPYEGT